MVSRPVDADDEFIEIDDGDTIWRFERDFMHSNWTCLFGNGCKGILAEEAETLNQGCCSLGAHFGDGEPGQAEAGRAAEQGRAGPSQADANPSGPDLNFSRAELSQYKPVRNQAEQSRAPMPKYCRNHASQNQPDPKS